MNKRIVLPFAALGVGVVLSTLLVVARPSVEPKPIERIPPLVEALTLRPERVHLQVTAQGTVVPRRESELVPQVSGEVVWVSPNLAPGGFFEKDEPLLRIDAVDYQAELESGRAALARAKSEAVRARKERDRQRQLAGRSVASQSRIDDSENDHAVAEAMLREARASLGRAERNLARTEMLAPFAGRVRKESVDVGQFVSRGSALASLYAVDYAEVRLPLPDRELRYLKVPLGYSADRPGAHRSTGVEVTLRAEFAGRMHEWKGQIVRSEGEIDPRSRMVTLVARVADPYGRTAAEPHATPLAVGLFVQAEIRGLELADAIVVPRSALQDGDRVLVIDSDDRIHFRDVDVLRRERERVIVSEGLAAGERILTTPMPAAVEGMSVRTRKSGPNLARASS